MSRRTTLILLVVAAAAGLGGCAPAATPAAPPPLEVEPGQFVGEIRQGIFLAALASKDVTPAQLSWAFRDASGTVVTEGAGIED